MALGRSRVLVDRLMIVPDAEVVFETMYLASDHAFWLDGCGSRFSIIGDAAGPLARIARADVRSGTVEVTSALGTRLIHSGFFDWLDRELAGVEAEIPALPFGFALGWVGYLGYELKAECGGSRAHRADDPDAVLVFADRAVVIDHHTATGYLLALAPRGDDASARAWLADTARRLATAAATTPSARRESVTAAGAGTLEARPRHGRPDYLDMIGRCLDAIARGDSYEVCLTNMITASGTRQPWPTYQRLRRLNPAPYAALLRLGELSVLSSSPERFLTISADGAVESRPIKGTRPRGDTEAHDAWLRDDLATNAKDRAENVMIVDLVRNDLGSCAEVGSVRVPRIFEVETYATVHQLVSTVRARLRAGVTPVRCVRACFPGGSMTGAPKIRTMELIDEFERGPRGVYSGAIGYFSLSGAVNLSVAIRTLTLRPDGASFGVGGAIIAASDPAAEFEETAVKAAALLDALGLACPSALRAGRTAACPASGSPTPQTRP